jgi:hypothetical protein
MNLMHVGLGALAGLAIGYFIFKPKDGLEIPVGGGRTVTVSGVRGRLGMTSYPGVPSDNYFGKNTAMAIMQALQ